MHPAVCVEKGQNSPPSLSGATVTDRRDDTLFHSHHTATSVIRNLRRSIRRRVVSNDDLDGPDPPTIPSARVIDRIE
jgi:hypothetical protein